ncbi:MAG: 2TM domain-containing protein, partial [Spirochaetota bacterium]
MLGLIMEHSYDPDSSKNIMDTIRKAILEDTRTMGRRLTVAEAMERYGEYGVEAREVIATMADKGILIKRTNQAGTPNTGTPDHGSQDNGSPDLAKDIGRAVESIARAIEIKVGDWQEQSRQQEGRSRGSHHGQQRGAGWQRDLDGKMEGIAARIERHAERAVDSIEQHMSGKPRYINEKQAIKEELRRHSAEVGTGKWDAELKGSDYFKPGSEEIETDFGRYKAKVEDRARKSSSGFVGNLISFAGVNALLWYINLTFSPGFTWAAIVSMAWGTGVVSNFFAMIRGKNKVAELERMPAMEAEALDTYKKLNRVKDSMALHTASMLSVPPLLFTINLLTSPGFLWAAIPSGIMALSFLGHLASFP